MVTVLFLSHSRCLAVSLYVSLIVFLRYASLANHSLSHSCYKYSRCWPLPSSSTMPTIEEIVQLAKKISTLSSSLPPSVPKATPKDKIWTVWQTQEGDTPFETFNKRFDALFSEDCRDAEGRLPHIRQGKSGMGLVSGYLKKLDWSEGFPLDLVAIKLQRLAAELTHIM